MTDLKQAIRELHQLTQSIDAFLKLDETSDNDYSSIASEMDDLRSDLISDETYKEAAAILYCGDGLVYLEDDYNPKHNPNRDERDEVDKILTGRGNTKRASILPLLEKALEEWINEMPYPHLGKFESEELYRVASAYFGKEVR